MLARQREVFPLFSLLLIISRWGPSLATRRRAVHFWAFTTCNIRAFLENTLQRLNCIRYFNLVKNETDKMTHSADWESTQSSIYQETTGSHQALFVVLEYHLHPGNTRGHTRVSAFGKPHKTTTERGTFAKPKGSLRKPGIWWAEQECRTAEWPSPEGLLCLRPERQS